LVTSLVLCPFLNVRSLEQSSKSLWKLCPCDYFSVNAACFGHGHFCLCPEV
jgi:hypothetical protein